MAKSGCAKEPTFSEQIGATQYVQATSQAVARYSTPAAAQAAGYEPVSPTDYPIVYYVNPTIVTANQSSERSLDPSAVDGLVYATTPSGEQVLVAAMYLLPDTLTQRSANALRLARPVAPTHRSLCTRDRIAGCPSCDFGVRSVCSGFNDRTDSVYDDGVAGSCRRWTTCDSTARHSDRRGGDDADQLVRFDERCRSGKVGAPVTDACVRGLFRPWMERWFGTRSMLVRRDLCQLA